MAPCILNTNIHECDRTGKKNLPNLHAQFLHLLHLRQGQSCQIGKPVQFGVHLQHPLSVVTVSGAQIVAMARDEGSHPLGSSLDISDIFSPKDGAGVALLTGREL